MKIVFRYDLKDRSKKWGVTGIDEVNGRQTYPYDTRGEAQARLELERKKQNPKDPRFKDRQFEATLKRLDRI